VPSMRPGNPLNIYATLDVRAVINCKGAYTMLGASKPWPDLYSVMQEASRYFVDLGELQDKIGERLARLIGTESAMVTSGAAAAITLGTCGCLTGNDLGKIQHLPALTGRKTEVIIQAAHRNPFDHCVRSTGAKLLVVRTKAQFLSAAGPKTAMMYYLGSAQHSPVSLEECLEVAKKAGFPIMVDAANMLPPWENVKKMATVGADLICISGGKHMRGPQNTGILAGRRDLIRGARLNSGPHEDTLGRPMKVGRGEMVAVLIAAERYAKLDFVAIQSAWMKQAQFLVRELSTIPGVTSEFAPYETVRRIPRVAVSWNEQEMKLSAAECQKQLLEGSPRIAVLENQPQGILLAMFMADPGDERLVVRRFRQIFSAIRDLRSRKGSTR
jgi:L-seryl-tRNA(Ser) seleniumtransferase